MTDLLHIDGKPFVLVPMHEYRRLLNGGQIITHDLPEGILDQISAGQQHPIRILRKFRGITQAELAAQAGLSRPYLTEIETRKKMGSVTALKAIARAMAVPIELVLSDAE